MATPDQLEMLAGKALLDASFLERLIDDPQGAANSVGLSLTADQVRKLKDFQEKRAQLLDLQEQIQNLRGDTPQIRAQRAASIAW